MFILDNRPLAVGVAFTFDGVQYPSNWLNLSSLEEKVAIGITEVPDEPPVDGRFYFSAGHPRSLEDCIAVHVNAVNAYVASVMAQSDWMVSRAAEGYKPVPADILAYRKIVRDHGNTLVTEVKALTKVEDVIAWSQHDWPVDPRQVEPRVA